MSESGALPTIYIIAGPNGAGKTTFAKIFLPKYARCIEFVNADLIAAGLSPFNASSMNIHAAQLMLDRMQNLAARRTTFAVETNLSGHSYLKKIPQWKSLGYQIVLLFFWLPSVELAIRRVTNRVKQGGHDIPEPIIRRRYQLGLMQFFESYISLVDQWQLLDSSMPRVQPIATGEGLQWTVENELIWKNIFPGSCASGGDDRLRTKIDYSLGLLTNAAAIEVAKSVVRIARFADTPVVTEQNAKITELATQDTENQWPGL
jgi:predicted ABC-type ATPase